MKGVFLWITMFDIGSKWYRIVDKWEKVGNKKPL